MESLCDHVIVELTFVRMHGGTVPISDLFQLVDFKLVRWDLASKLFATWTGMVFVVSFASCLDVAAISMDMGEALDTNKELMTVGIGNCKIHYISNRFRTTIHACMQTIHVSHNQRFYTPFRNNDIIQ
jgi:hypothetical protein